MTTPHLPPGSIVGGRFSIQSELGRGPLSATYRAITAPNREVAIRLFDPQSGDVAAIVDALRRLQAELDSDLHRFVVPIVEIGHDAQSGAPFAVAPFIATPSLGQMVELCPFEPADAAVLALNLGRALDALHARRLVHLALKPTNVFVGPAPTWTVRLTDIAPRVATPGAGPPSPWVAPEQGEGGSGGVAADVFTTGLLVLHSLIGGAGRPSLGNGVDASKYARAWGVELPASVDPIFRRALSVNPSQRPVSVGALVRDLATALEPAKRWPPVPPRIRRTPAEDDPPTSRMSSAPEAPATDPPTMRMASVAEAPAPDEEPTSRLASVPEVPSFAEAGEMRMGPPSPEAFFPSVGGVDNVSTALALPAGPPPTDAGFNLEPAGVGRRSSKMPYIAGALVLLGVIGTGLIAASQWARSRPAQDATTASTTAATTALGRGAPKQEIDAAAPEPLTSSPTPPPPAPSASEAPAASDAPSEPSDAAAAEAEAASVKLGADQGELTVLCEPLACDLVMIDGKPMTAYPGPAALHKGLHGVGISRRGFGGQWQQVSLRQGERKAVHFKLTVLGPPAPPPKKQCGKFLQRCD